MQIQDNESYSNAVECFDFDNRQAKFIVNSVRVYEFFDFSWRIPLWDNDLIDFFRRVPLKYRTNTYLYRRYAVEKLFVDLAHELGRIDCTTSLPDNPRLQGLTNKISGLFWNKVNFFNSNSFNTESALIWVFTKQNPGLFKIENKLSGYKPGSCCDSEIIREIVIHSRNARSMPSINGLGTYAYLTDIVREDSTFIE